MDAEKLREVLAAHAQWLAGNGGSRANLPGADLHGADLRNADLHGANLHGADLSDASLHGADLSDASLRGANLRYANLQDANLRGANLRGANLQDANLQDANLQDANLRGANLQDANLQDANLRDAILDLPICRMDFGGWSICITSEKTSVGCQTHANEQWLAWSADSDEIKEMHADAAAWWSTHGEAVKAAIRCVMAKAKGAEVQS